MTKITLEEKFVTREEFNKLLELVHYLTDAIKVNQQAIKKLLEIR